MTWVKVEGKHSDREVKMYSLSYCHACMKTKNYLMQRKVAFRYLDVDKAEPKEREEAAEVFGMDLPEGGITIAFPIIIVGDKIIIGFDREKISNVLKQNGSESESV